MRRLKALVDFLGLAASTRITFKDGIYTVTMGGQIADWQKFELIKKFRSEFSSSTIVEHGEGVNISGESAINVRF